MEEECWRKANEEEEVEEELVDSLTMEMETAPPWTPRIPTCQIDASWIANGSVSGLGWSFKDHMGSEFFGLRACRRTLSALHAEMEGLLWAASCIRNMRITTMRFETDCTDLVDMVTNPEDWPAFVRETDLFRSLQEGFEDVRVSHIPRDRNGRADALAKEARNRGYTFTHIDQTRSDGGDLRRTGSSNHHLI